MKYFKYQIGLVTILLLSLITINSYNILKEFNNKNIEYINNYKQLQNKRNSFYDMLWNTFDTKSKISGISKNVFIDITKVIMDSRKDGINVTWKWLQENQNIDYNEYTKFYIDLSNYIEIKRTEMYQIDLEVQKLVLNQNNFIMSWPNKFINNWIFKYPLLNFETFKNEKNIIVN